MAALLAGCGDEFTKTEFGSEYKFIEKANGKVPGPGDLMLVQMENMSGDSVIMRTVTKDGLTLTPSQGPDILTSVFKLCTEGDSVHIRLPVDDYGTATRSALNRQMAENKTVLMKMRVTKVVNRQEYLDRRNAEAAEQRRQQLEKDKEIIENYIAENNLKAESTEQGLYYVIEKKGRGKLPTQGEFVSVNYVLRLLDGTFIDSSDEQLNRENNTYNSRRTYGPYKFRLGTRAVIDGWDIGIGMINKGTKAKFLVPSGLAYRETTGPGGKLPPNSVLIFDVELVEIGE